MNSLKILIGIAVLTTFYITYSQSIACYTCNDKSSCKKPSKFKCTQSLANMTRTFLEIYHKKVPITTSPHFECFSEQLKSFYGDFCYKGCVYSHIRACNLEIKDFYSQSKFQRFCDQCKYKNYCNPTDHEESNVEVPKATMNLAMHDSANIFPPVFSYIAEQKPHKSEKATKDQEPLRSSDSIEEEGSGMVFGLIENLLIL